MNNRRYRLSRKAVQDLNAVWNDALSRDPASAEALLKRIEAKLEFACVYPHSGAVRPEINENARILIDAPCIIMYEVQENDLLVVSIVHAGLQAA